MSNFSTKKILGLVITLLIGLIFAYAFLTFCFPSGNIRDFFSELSLTFINGFVLALAVLLLGIFLEESRVKELKKEKLSGNLSILKNLIKNTFQRGKSDWNFVNRTSTFYFDDDWINPLYDLLTQNNREWEIFLQEYKEHFNDNNLIEGLDEFIKKMDLALINTEKLDSKLKFQKIGPELSASYQSGYRGDRLQAKRNAEFEFWIFRATWAGANTTKIMFGFAPFTEDQIIFERIEGLSNEASSLAKTEEYKKLVSKLKSDKTELSRKIEAIRTLIKNDRS